MNGFVLMLRHNMDDVPIGLFSTYAKALEAAAKRKNWFLTAKEENIFNCAPSTPIVMAIVEFKSGVPVKNTIVRFHED